MNILSLFVIIPLITMFALMATKGFKQARLVAAIGMGIQVNIGCDSGFHVSE